MKAKGPSSQELYRLVLGMHLPVTSGHGNEVQLLLLCPDTHVDSSSPFSLQSARLSWSNLF